MKRRLIGWLVTLGFAWGACAAPPVTLSSLLVEMTDREAVARFPEPAYRCLQFSSYDRASVDPADERTWFANGDYNQYLRVEEHQGRKEWVMMDAAGPGAIVRVWSPNPKGVLRVYVDDGAAPVIEAPMAELLSGKAGVPGGLAAEASKGWNMYLPVPFAKRCVVTSDHNEFYYHVNYRVYEPGTVVESFSAGELAASRAEIERASATLLAERRSDLMQTAELPGGGVLPAGTSRFWDLASGPHAVRTLTMRASAADLEQALRSCVVEMTFDGEQTVWCPIADFFGSGVGVNAYQDWYRHVRAGGQMTCDWIMPYERDARLTIHNLGQQDVTLEMVGVVTDPWAWDERSMHFHAAWRDEYPIHAKGAAGTSDFNYVDVAGQGVYVGDNLSVMNPVKEWWGEGDEKIYVDGEKFPSHFGTGTEDYYGYGWCWPVKFARPFEAQVRVDGQEGENNWGRTAVTRTRSLDAIPFTKSLSMNIEVWHWKACDVEYATTAYFYARPGATTNRAPMPERAALPLVKAPELPKPFKIAGAIECESLKVSGSTPGLRVEVQGGFGPGVWSGEQQLWVQAHAVGEFVEFKIPAARKSGLAAYATASWDYAVVRFSINGKPVGHDVDLCSRRHEVLPTGKIDLGDAEPVDGMITVRVEVVGVNPGADRPGTYFGLDCFVVEPH